MHLKFPSVLDFGHVGLADKGTSLAFPLLLSCFLSGPDSESSLGISQKSDVITVPFDLVSLPPALPMLVSVHVDTPPIVCFQIKSVRRKQRPLLVCLSCKASTGGGIAQHLNVPNAPTQPPITKTHCQPLVLKSLLFKLYK